MNSKPLFAPIFFRLSAISLCFIFLLAFVYIFSSAHDDMKIYIIIFFSIFQIISIIRALFVFKNYTFTDEKIIIKIPLLSVKEYFIKDIVGFIKVDSSENINVKMSLLSDKEYLNKTMVDKLKSENDKTLIVYTDKTRFIISMLGGELSNAVNRFVNENYEKIKMKNIEELERKGILVNINKNKRINFFNDYLDIIENENKERYYYKRLSVKYLAANAFIFVAKDNTNINVNISQCKGKFGFFEYLMDYQWELDEAK